MTNKQLFKDDSFYSFITIKNIHCHIQRDFIGCIPTGWWRGGLSHCSGLCSRDLGQIGILGGNWHFGWRCFFSGGTWKFPTYIKNSEYESQTKKNDSNCNFYNFWPLLVPYPNNFLVVCLFVLIFHGLYTPPQIFLLWG